MTAVHALCPVVSVELGKAKIGAFRAQHACKRYTGDGDEGLDWGLIKG